MFGGGYRGAYAELFSAMMSSVSYYDRYDGYDGYDDFHNRHMWREKSDAAMRREQQANDAFTKLKAQVDKDGVAQKTTFELLPPSVHLTQPCYTSFRKVVTKYPGWNVSRRVATAEEKAAHKETRQAKVYFTSVTYDPKKGGVIVGTNSAAAKAAHSGAALQAASGNAAPSGASASKPKKAAATVPHSKKAKINPNAAMAMQENVQPPVKKQKKVKPDDADDSPDWHP